MPPSPERPTLQVSRHSPRPKILIAVLVIVLLAVGAWSWMYFYSTKPVANPTTDAQCDKVYSESSQQGAQDRIQALQVVHPDVTVLEASLDLFYSPALSGCVIGNFARIQSTSPLRPDQFSDALFQADGTSTVVGYFTEASTGQDITPQSPQWNSLLQDLSASEAQKNGTVAASPSSDAECEAAYEQNVMAVVQTDSTQGGSISKALFYSQSLQYCVGIVAIIKGNVHSYDSFNAATTQQLNPDDNVKALQDYSSYPGGGTFEPVSTAQ
jgi:hypothetical protein